MRIILMIICLVAFKKTDAQIQTDTIGRSDLATLFQNLSAANIPTGYLMDWGTDMTDKDDLNGLITDSNFVNNIDIILMVYADIYSAKFAANAQSMFSPDSLNNLIDSTPVPSGGGANLVMVYGQYAITNPNSINNGWLIYNRGRLTETGTGSPYNTEQVWAAYPTEAFYQNTVTFRFLPSLFVTNTGANITALSIDFGNGYTLVAPNSTISNTYTDSSGYKIIKIKALLSNGEQMETQMVVQVELDAAGGSANRYSPADLEQPDFIVPRLNGVHAGCRVFLRRSVATPANQILKPFIVVEGLDISTAVPKLATNYQINKLINEWNDLIFKGYDFSQQLDSIANYDLIFVDWNNGVGDIPGNAVALESVLDWVNAVKAASGSTQQNVIMGISMGGLISRYCLANMVKRTPRKPTGTRLLLTMDSPHQGSYIPLAFQHVAVALPEARGPLFLRLGTIIKNLDRIKYDVLQSPAAQQQLKLLVTDDNGSVAANTFLNSVYRPMISFTNPAVQPEYDFRAVSNGSQCGIPVLQPGDNLATGNASIDFSRAILLAQVLTGTPLIVTKFKYRADIVAKSLTGSSSHQIIDFRLRRLAKLFFFIPVNRTLVHVLQNEPSFNSTPWESLPGGTVNMGERTNNNGDGPKTFFGKILKDILDFLIPVENEIVFAPAFGFVPTTSALDIQNAPSQNGQYIFPVQGQNGSNASSYIAQEFLNGQGGFNVNHTDFTARNAQWIFREMENIPQDINCTYDCPLAYNTTISGLI